MEEEFIVLEVINSGDVIALRTPPNEKSSFYLCLVKDIVSNADEDSFDAYNHYITKGSCYIRCNYLKAEEEEHRRRSQTFTQYHTLSQLVYVLPGEVLSPSVDITSDFKLYDEEKQWLNDMA